MPRIISFEELYSEEYSAQVINAVKHINRVVSNYNCIGAPKRQSIFLYLNSCKAKYVTKNNKVYVANPGDIIYNPQFAEYKVDFFDFKDDAENYYWINFKLFDNDGELLLLTGSDVIISTPPSPQIFKPLFSEIADHSSAAIQSPAAMKALFYEILSKLSLYNRHKNITKRNLKLIEYGIKYLEEDKSLTLSIEEIAKRCNVSEGYFRRLFKEYSGMSPNEYKLNAKLNKAKQYLQYESMSIQEVSEICGFYDSSYFCKIFKKHFTMTPKKYQEYFSAALP
jgi:AraC-like DNA-binding protein